MKSHFPYGKDWVEPSYSRDWEEDPLFEEKGDFPPRHKFQAEGLFLVTKIISFVALSMAAVMIRPLPARSASPYDAEVAATKEMKALSLTTRLQTEAASPSQGEREMTPEVSQTSEVGSKISEEGQAAPAFTPQQNRRRQQKRKKKARQAERKTKQEARQAERQAEKEVEATPPTTPAGQARPAKPSEAAGSSSSQGEASISKGKQVEARREAEKGVRSVSPGRPSARPLTLTPHAKPSNFARAQQRRSLSPAQARVTASMATAAPSSSFSSNLSNSFYPTTAETNELVTRYGQGIALPDSYETNPLISKHMWQDPPNEIVGRDPMALATARNQQAWHVASELYDCAEINLVYSVRMRRIVRRRLKKQSHRLRWQGEICLRLTRDIYLNSHSPENRNPFLLFQKRRELDANNREFICRFHYGYHRVKSYRPTAEAGSGGGDA